MKRRMILAFVVAPLVAPAAVWLTFLINALITAQFSELGKVFLALPGVLALGAPVAWAVTVVGGVPLYLLLRRAGYLRLIPLMACGALLGALLFRIVYQSPLELVVCALGGAGAGFVFWYIGIRTPNHIAAAA